MQHILKLLLLLMTGLLFMGTSPQFSHASQTPDGPEVYRLPNGLKVVIQQDKRFPLVSMRLYVHAGSAFENDRERGITHLIEHMVFKGTEKRPVGGVAGDIEKAGGYTNAATSFDYTVYMADMPAEQWQVGLDVLNDMVFHAKLDPAELESEKKVVIAELKRGEDSPSGRLFKNLQAAALSGTPYAHPVIGYEDVINAITRDDMIAYMSRLYQPQSMMLLICGNVDEVRLKAEIERLYGGLKNTQSITATEQAVIPQRSGEPVITVEKGEWNKVYLGLALPSIGTQNAQSVQLDILTSLLGDGRTSYLYRKYKYDKQLVDSISIYNYGMERMGLLYMGVVLDADKLPLFWNEFTKDLAKLGGITFTQRELDRIKLNLEDEMFREKETIAGLASKLGYFEFFSGGQTGEENYLYSLRETRLDNLTGQLNGILHKNALAVSVLLPEDYAKNDITPETLLATLNTNWKEADTPKNSPATEVTTGARDVIELGQGRTLILMSDDTLPYISASLMYTGGDSLLKPQEQGLATATASMLGKGTKTLNANAYEDYLADRAASLVASAGRQSFALSLTAPKRFTPDVLKLLDETINQPAFAQDELKRVLTSQASTIKATEDRPLDLAFRRMFPFLFGDHPYGLMQLGTPDSIKGISTNAVRAFWEKQKHQPWVLSVCGDFDRDAIIAAAKALPAPTGKAPEITAPNWTAKKELTLKLPGRNQTHIMLVFPTAPIASEDAPALDLLQSVLSGQSGILFTELRDKQGLGYTVTAIPWMAQKAGALVFYIGTEPGKVEQAKKGFMDVIADITKTPLPEEKLQGGKNAIQGEYYRNHQSLGARSSEAATLAVLGLPLDLPQQEMAKGAKLTPEQLRDVARKYLNLDKAHWVIVTP